jgi:glutathione-regulated potassium-efflux system ancillary protein KefF
MLDLVFAHPYPARSRANRALLEAVRDLEGVELRSLYDEYPDFDIDVPREQAALVSASIVVWQHPLYWYTVPGLLKHWFDKVLLRGFAYGEGGTALRGKRCLWVATAGGDEEAYSAGGMHGHPLETFVPVVEQTALFCGMRWEPPIVLKSSHRVSGAELERASREYRARLQALLAEERSGS